MGGNCSLFRDRNTYELVSTAVTVRCTIARTFKMALLICLRSLDGAHMRVARVRRAGKTKI